MKKQWAVALVGIGMTFVIALLWLRVRGLEKSIDSLTRQLQSKPGVIAVGSAEIARPKEAKGQKIFKLIDSAPANGGSTEIGVPWSVERGMMIDAVEHAEPRPEAPRYETWHNAPPVQLQEPLFKQPSESFLNDGSFN